MGLSQRDLNLPASRYFLHSPNVIVCRDEPACRGVAQVMQRKVDPAMVKGRSTQPLEPTPVGYGKDE